MLLDPFTVYLHPWLTVSLPSNCPASAKQLGVVLVAHKPIKLVFLRGAGVFIHQRLPQHARIGGWCCSNMVETNGRPYQ
jgi:hypothetical protein